MLDHAKVMQSLSMLSDKLFPDYSADLTQVQRVWEKLCADTLLSYKIAPLRDQIPLVSWQGNINTKNYIKEIDQNYAVLAVDGSQIYPDRHQGTLCSLINIGGIWLEYGKSCQAQLYSKPYVFAPVVEEGVLTADLIDCRRQELELSSAITLWDEKRIKTDNCCVLFDGSLIFWHLEMHEENVQREFAQRYMSALCALQERNVLCAWYISYSKSRELAALINLAAVDFSVQRYKEQIQFPFLVDTHCASFFLEPGTYSTIFVHESERAKRYPPSFRPCFFYMHIGQEIARVEIPFWLAIQQELVAKIASILFDQQCKGQGYPISIAEAHEQAVVKSSDREMFYHLVRKYGIEHKARVAISPKFLKKRKIGI